MAAKPLIAMVIGNKVHPGNKIRVGHDPWIPTIIVLSNDYGKTWQSHSKRISLECSSRWRTN